MARRRIDVIACSCDDSYQWGESDYRDADGYRSVTVSQPSPTVREVLRPLGSRWYLNYTDVIRLRRVSVHADGGVNWESGRVAPAISQHCSCVLACEQDHRSPTSYVWGLPVRIKDVFHGIVGSVFPPLRASRRREARPGNGIHIDARFLGPRAKEFAN